MTAKHVCVRFYQDGPDGRLQTTKVSVVNGRREETRSDQTLWRCRECGTSIWLQTGVDPNVVSTRHEGKRRGTGRKV
jgi:hypothetical protein